MFEHPEHKYLFASTTLRQSLHHQATQVPHQDAYQQRKPAIMFAPHHRAQCSVAQQGSNGTHRDEARRHGQHNQERDKRRAHAAPARKPARTLASDLEVENIALLQNPYISYGTSSLSVVEWVPKASLRPQRRYTRILGPLRHEAGG